MRGLKGGVLAAALCCASPAVLAQEQAGADQIDESPDPARRAVVVPALTPVMIEVLATLGSRESTTGDTFPIRLAQPIIIDGVEAVPAGTPGLGEVIHAKKNGGSGAAGELVLAARYLDVGADRLPLRSLRFDASARDRMGTVEALTIASAAVAPVASFLGFLIKGDQLSLSSGSILTAKTAAEFTVEIAAPSTDSSGGEPGETAAGGANAGVAATAEVAATSSATGEETQ